MAFVGLFQFTAFGQKKYEMVVEKTDGSETVFNVEDISRTYFRERSDGGGGGVNPGGGGGDTYTTCPDANHPHMIDLGLPSGTKWACCNVGASTPEDYGSYYAWGETSPKSVYSKETYQYYQNGNFVNIGSDIAGTGYDAATANWGAPWRMPTRIQCKELGNKCTSVWTTQNGVSVRKFTGPNGGTIFIPAAGYRKGSSKVGSGAYFWSSTLSDTSPGEAWEMNIYSGGWGMSGDDRDWGQSVRPVR